MWDFCTIAKALPQTIQIMIWKEIPNTFKKYGTALLNSCQRHNYDSIKE